MYGKGLVDDKGVHFLKQTPRHYSTVTAPLVELILVVEREL